MNGSKCQFRASQVKHFAHCITATGLHPDRSKIRTLLSIAELKSRDELRRFNGMVNVFVSGNIPFKPFEFDGTPT